MAKNFVDVGEDLDVKDLIDKKGVPGFWKDAIIKNRKITHKITNKDKPLLMFLKDIVLT
jgi:hypothetical protein